MGQAEERVTAQEKNGIKTKLFEFQKSGLELYGEYLANQLKSCGDSSLKKHYRKYIVDQIHMNNEKLVKLELRLANA